MCEELEVEKVKVVCGVTTKIKVYDNYFSLEMSSTQLTGSAYTDTHVHDVTHAHGSYCDAREWPKCQ